MKIVLLCDTHFGKGGNNKIYHDNNELFFKNILFPYLDETGIKKIIHLGDVFDSRKSADFLTLKNSRNYFFDPLLERNIQMDVIIGNHDVYFRDSNNVNSVSLVLKDYTNINWYQGPIEKDDFLYIPWINKENAQDTYNLLKNTKNKIVFGHLELNGFRLNKSQIDQKGMSSKIFENFDLVMSGHFHTKNSKGNIFYLGSATQQTWIDDGEDKGFHVLDTETLELEFIKNPYNLYSTIHFDGSNNDIDMYKNKIVRIYANDIQSKSDLEKYVKQLEKSGCYEVRVIESFSGSVNHEMLENIEVEDTIDIIKTYISSLEIANKNDVMKYMLELYYEAESLK